MPKRRSADTSQEDAHSGMGDDLPMTSPRKLLNPSSRIPKDQGVDNASAAPHASSKWRSPRPNSLSNFETSWKQTIGSEARVLGISSSAALAPPSHYPSAEAPRRLHVSKKPKIPHDANEETAPSYSREFSAAPDPANNYASFGVDPRGACQEVPQPLHRNLNSTLQGSPMHDSLPPGVQGSLGGPEDPSVQRQTSSLAKITQDMWFPGNQAQAKRRAARRSGTNRNVTLPCPSRPAQEDLTSAPVREVLSNSEPPQSVVPGTREENFGCDSGISAQGVEHQVAPQARASRAASVMGVAEWDRGPSLVTCKGMKYTPEQEQWLLAHCIDNYDSRGMRREWYAVRQAFAQRFGQLREIGSLQMKYNNTAVIQSRRVMACRARLAEELVEGADGERSPGFTAINTTPVEPRNTEGPLGAGEGSTNVEESTSSQAPAMELSGSAPSTPGSFTPGDKFPRRPYTKEQCTWLVSYVRDHFTIPGRKLTWGVVNSAFTARFGPYQERSQMSISKKWSDLTKGRRR